MLRHNGGLLMGQPWGSSEEGRLSRSGGELVGVGGGRRSNQMYGRRYTMYMREKGYVWGKERGVYRGGNVLCLGETRCMCMREAQGMCT